MLDVFNLIETTHIDPFSSYISSYPHLVSYLSGLENISAKDVIRAAHMVYGWMPTILSLHPSKGMASFEQAALYLEKAKSGTLITVAELTKLSDLINNSVVGASKLLHFTAPEYYAIWDSRVCQFVYGHKSSYQCNKPERYFEYLKILDEIKERDGFSMFHQAVNSKVGYEVSSLRAIEIVMFENSKG